MPRTSESRRTSAARPPRAAWTIRVALLVLVVAGLLVPLHLPVFWQQVLVFSAAAAIAAIGLQFLIGSSGQLSLAHAFFIAIGAYGYSYFGPSVPGATVDSVGLPSAVAALLAIALAGAVGLVFSAVSARLRGLYLGLASLALVIIGQHILTQAKPVTGGVFGRDAPELALGSFRFDDDHPYLAVAGTQLSGLNRIWILSFVLLVLAFSFLRNVERSRVGRAMHAIRDSEPAAAASGVPVQVYKATAFVLSSLYAGIGGVLTALAYQHVVPTSFDLALSLDFLAMIVIGGMGSMAGSVIGAFVVTALPLVLSNYSSSIPLLAAPGSGGLEPGVVAQFVFGVVVIVALLARWSTFAPTLRRVISELPVSRRASITPPSADPPQTVSREKEVTTV